MGRTSKVSKTKKPRDSKMERALSELLEAVSQTNKQISKIATVADKTHTLVNSNMGIQLMLNAVVTRRLASITKDQDDEAAALKAEALLEAHEGKQKVVDAGKKIVNSKENAT
jgi:hypothetical protein